MRLNWRKVLLAAFAVTNGLLLGARTASARGWEVDRINYDANGTITGYVCSSCWLWGCDCNNGPSPH